MNREIEEYTDIQARKDRHTGTQEFRLHSKKVGGWVRMNVRTYVRMNVCMYVCITYVLCMYYVCMYYVCMYV
jgi:hypothetical protein